MSDTTSQIAFGIGTLVDGKPAVIVNDQAIAIATIGTRRAVPPGLESPFEMRYLMPQWDQWHDWLRGLDLKPSADDGWTPVDSLKFGPPVPEPWDMFSTYHNYERPSRVTGRSDPPKAERVLPDMFFGSRSSLAAHGDTVHIEHGRIKFDFEVEVTAVIGKTAFRVPAEKADEYIAGYAIANDLTMHHAWWRPIRSKSPINDNIRMKNFPGYTPMSRAIVPRDLVGDPRNLGVKAWVGGRLKQDTRTNKMLWSVPELVEYLSHIMPLRPGTLILTGSPEELPVPAGEEYKGIQPGESVLCEVEKLGQLENRIVEQTERQPHES
ncbi:MAG: fumarylacetoacetate hydrolase family protein [Betaproteobacteria bacterium]|nr:fumarylacetoacetate hydrolase family protein [Betaproteobacteria bacterium]